MNSLKTLVTRGALAALAAALPALAAAQQPLDKQDADAAVKAAYSKYKGLKDGKNADYIPALAKVPSELFAIDLMTTDGQESSAGDLDQEYSIQSISKVFTLARVLEDSGAKKVVNGVGVDATGDVFNSIKAIEQHKGHEMNPLVNPGAIATTSQVKGATPEEQWNAIIGTYNDFAGRDLKVNQEVYKSESDTNERNRAIAMLMHAYDLIAKDRDPLKATDIYTRQCSVSVNTRDLAQMAATLANGGKNPKTGKQVISADHAKQVLAVMATAGLYDNSGQWLFMTGLPAKSGVGGGIIAVSPGRFGIAAFSPRLDEAGNSVRAQKAIAEISDKLGGNPYAVNAEETQKTQPGR
jgi:glutaminase